MDIPLEFMLYSVIRAGVPLFRAHVRMDKQTGWPAYEVRDSDLEKIADLGCRREQQSGAVCRSLWGIRGRRSQRRDQPPVVGYYRRAATATSARSRRRAFRRMSIRNDFLPQRASYPHRSAEYWLTRGEISGAPLRGAGT